MSNSQFNESPAQYRRSVQTRDASARQQVALAQRDKFARAKNLEPERLISIEHLHNYLDQTVDETPGKLASALPDIKPRESLCEDYFKCNIWEVEPHLLDDLERAQESRDQKQIDNLRRYIRAASWASHGAVNLETATKLAQNYQASGENPELAASILQALAGCDDKIEDATCKIEKQVEKSWREFLTAWKAEKVKNVKLPWPMSKAPLHTLGYPQELLDKGEELVKFRKLRDQIYFNRLHSNLCRIATVALFEQRKQSY